MFDKNKMSSEKLETSVRSVIDNWTLPKNIEDKWIKNGLTEEMFKEKLVKIFVAGWK